LKKKQQDGLIEARNGTKKEGTSRGQTKDIDGTS
jgi:hypothetical protein